MSLVWQVHDLKYSNAGDKFLVISGTSQAKLYERDGEEVYVDFTLLCDSVTYAQTSATFIKGDPYIRDMKNTA
jgi:hypothetical protein